MDSFSWIAIYIPLLLILFTAYRQKKHMRLTNTRKRKRGHTMTNELLRSYLSKHCKISTGSMDNSITGTLKELNDNWLEVQTNKGIELVNIDYIQKIKILG